MVGCLCARVCVRSVSFAGAAAVVELCGDAVNAVNCEVSEDIIALYESMYTLCQSHSRTPQGKYDALQRLVHTHVRTHNPGICLWNFVCV